MLNIAAVIVAAGRSSRMGSCKPLLPLGDKTIIEQVADTFLKAGARTLVVVTGRQREDLDRRLAAYPIRLVHNQDFETTDMFHSVKLGFSAVPEEAGLVFFTPADIPLFTAETLQAMLERSEKAAADLVIPRHNDQGGHPLLLRRSCLDTLSRFPGEGGLRGAIASFPGRISYLETKDIGVLLDVDYPRDYNLARLIAKPPMPEKVLLHCRAVSRLALRLGRLLKAKGYELDLNLIELGGLFHDIARTEKDHSARGAQIFLEMGQTALSEIVRQHMEPDRDQLLEISEITVVYLADKLLRRDVPVTLEERFLAKKIKYKENGEAAGAIDRRYSTAKLVLTRFEQALGAKISSRELLKEEPL